MADVKQNNILIEIIPKAIEQRIVTAKVFNGVAPALALAAFVPYAGDDDGVVRMKQHDVPANDAGDVGGLFTFDHQQPISVVQILANFGVSTVWTVSIVKPDSDFPILTDTGQYIRNYGHDKAFLLMPGEKLKVVTATAPSSPNQGWVRIYARLAQNM